MNYFKDLIDFFSGGLLYRLERELRERDGKLVALAGQKYYLIQHIKRIGISPMMLGIDVEHFTHKDCKDMDCEKFDIKNNPVHAQVYNLMKDLVKHGNS